MEPIIPHYQEVRNPIKKGPKRRVLKKASSSKEDYDEDPGSPIRTFE